MSVVANHQSPTWAAVFILPVMVTYRYAWPAVAWIRWLKTSVFVHASLRCTKVDQHRNGHCTKQTAGFWTCYLSRTPSEDDTMQQQLMLSVSNMLIALLTTMARIDMTNVLNESNKASIDCKPQGKQINKECMR